MQYSKDKILKFIQFSNYHQFKNPYFTWNSFEKSAITEEDLDDSESNIEELLWDFGEENDEVSYRSVSDAVNVFKLHNDSAVQTLCENYHDSEIVFIDKKMEPEIRYKKTIQAFENESVKLIINPFIYTDKYELNLFFIDKHQKEIGALKFSAKTLAKDFLKAFYNLFLIDDLDKTYFSDLVNYNYCILIMDYLNSLEKGKISYKKTYTINIQKTFAFDSKRKNDLIVSNYVDELIKKSKFISGEYVFKKRDNDIKNRKANLPYSYLNYSVKEIFNKMKDGTLHSSIKYDNEIYKLVSLIEKPIYIYNEIIRRKSISKLVIDKYDLESRLYNKFSDVPFKSDLLTYFYPDAKKYNQVKFKLHKLASEAEWINLKKYIEKLEKELKVVDQELTKTEIDKYLIKDIKYIWYDFETISFPFCAIDNFVPYTKIPFQVSIIRTMNSTQLQGEDEAENLIIDPINIDLEQIAKFIDRIYSFADLQNNLPARYITYNKAFENSVLRSIVNIMEMSNFLNYEIYQKKVEQIIDNTLDLNDFFKESKSLILIGELYWKSSIKLVEKFITKHNYPFKNMIIPYSSLDIQNGLVAMEAGIKRYMGNITDEVWKSDYEKNLKTYCENDVKAMLMVFELIKDIFKNQYPELGNFSNPY